jgi:small-conductance mechanosensitive channel/CRP-like cAMP-binding protein
MTILAAWTLMREGANLKLSDTLLRLGMVLIAYLAFTGAQRLVNRQSLVRSIGVLLNLLVLLLLALVGLQPALDQMNSDVRDAIKATAVFLGVAMGLKLFDRLYFDRLAQWQKKPPVPLVVRDLARWGLVVIALVVIVRSYFPGVNLNVLAVSSLVVGYIVGNATQDTLGNLFAGLALNAERPFEIGDWITVGGHTGALVDTTWRATRLRTLADDYIVIPNSAIAKESIVNYSRPTGIHGCYVSVGVSYDTPPNKTREVIRSVLRETPEVCSDPAPSVYLAGYGDFAINFTIKYFIRDYSRLNPIQSGLMDRIWYAFRREGIAIPYPIQDARHRDAMADEQALRSGELEAIRHLLTGVDLFQSLSPQELNRVVDGTKLKLFAAGEHLCRQGEAGDSFYVIRSGQVAVLMNNADGQPVTVAHLSHGAFFGEMSLLTGEPRSGTVTAEADVEVLWVSKAVFAGLLRADADLAGKLAAVLEKRAAERRTIMSTPSVSSETAFEARNALTARIRRFFGLS